MMAPQIYTPVYKLLFFICKYLDNIELTSYLSIFFWHWSRCIPRFILFSWRYAWSEAETSSLSLPETKMDIERLNDETMGQFWYKEDTIRVYGFPSMEEVTRDGNALVTITKKPYFCFEISSICCSTYYSFNWTMKHHTWLVLCRLHTCWLMCAE